MSGPCLLSPLGKQEGLAGLIPSVLSHRVYEYQRVPPLTNHMPVKVRRSHTGMGVKRSFSPQKALRKSHVPPGQIKSE